MSSSISVSTSSPSLPLEAILESSSTSNSILSSVQSSSLDNRTQRTGTISSLPSATLAILSSSAATSSISSSSSLSAPRSVNIEAEIAISPEKFAQWVATNRKIELILANLLNRSIPDERPASNSSRGIDLSRLSIDQLLARQKELIEKRISLSSEK